MTPPGGPHGEPSAATIVALLDDVMSAAHRHARPDQADRLAAARSRVARPPSHVVVVGEFKKGKSSLINALLNVRVCPTDADIATAVPSYIRHGEHVAVRELADNASPAAPGVTQPECRWIDASLTAAAATGAHPGAAALDITVPRDLLRDGMVIVDTPGLGGGLSSAHASAALRALHSSASVAVVVADASAEYSAAELGFIRSVADECPDVICVLTKIDLYPAWRRIAEADRGHLEALGLAVDLLPISSALRRAGLQAGDDDLLVESGFPELTARLVAATRNRTRPGLGEAAAAARSVTAQLVTAVTDRRAMLADAHGASETTQAWQADERVAADLKGAGSRWQQVLAEGMAELQSDTDVDLVTRIRSLRKEAVATIAELPSQRMTADVGPWLQRRTNEELLDHVRQVRRGAEQVADAVAAQFGQASRLMRAEVGPSVDPSLGDTATAVAFDARMVSGASGESGMAALRGGATGAVVANAVGLAFSIAVPVLIPVTVALAAVLAGKSWRSARAGQERALRIDLERAVVAYLDDVDVLARRDSRASVRRVQRQLRESFTERAAELHETARRAAQDLRADAARADADKRSQLADLDQEVERLRALHARAAMAVAAVVAARGRAPTVRRGPAGEQP